MGLNYVMNNSAQIVNTVGYNHSDSTLKNKVLRKFLNVFQEKNKKQCEIRLGWTRFYPKSIGEKSEQELKCSMQKVKKPWPALSLSANKNKMCK